ncbi:MAG: 6-bladed beta-propeller [Gemmatimonadetes bacterium]|nr:6-bladed beta-propeller [Gemmatimonadota bacterium]
MTQPGPRYVLTLTVALSACDASPPAATPTRETLPNGALLVRYPALPAIDHVGPEVAEAHVDLRLGTRGGDDPNFIFGDIRGVQAASDGTIFVLDYQAIEVRVFSPDGEFLRTIVRQGEGPGEVREANGIVLSGDTLLWVNDHGQWAVVGVDPQGEELRRFSKPIRSYGYIWDGTFDRQGRYWRQDEHADDEELVDEETGPYEESFRSYFKSYDLSTEEVDSVYLGESIWRGYASVTELGSSYYGLPFAVSNIAAVDPSGGFWSLNTGSYRLVRRGEGGDTLMVIEASLPRVPVTSEDRSSYIQGIVDRRPEELRAAEAVAALMPDFKPVLEDMFMDDEGRLWVKRAVPADAPPFFDLFSDDGDYLGSIRLGFAPAPYRPLWVQHGNIYAVIEDELDVPYVVRGAVGR